MAQLSLPSTPTPAPSADRFYSPKWSALVVDAFGTSQPAATEGEAAFRKELRNKLAWAIGTAYGVAYSKRLGPVMLYAEKISMAVLRDHGHPRNVK